MTLFLMSSQFKIANLWILIPVSIVIDQYSLIFSLVLFYISVAVIKWSYYYMDREELYRRFIYILYIFILCIYMLIFFSNLYFVLVGWDGLGITSFLLVIYYKNRKSIGSGMITAMTNRIGDCLFFCVLGFLCYDWLLLSLLVVIRITKRAQFPFSSWLPAAMSAPTPVSALVHSSTLVTAGVYVLIRFAYAMEYLLYVGSFTVFVSGVAACVERDMKKVVALSTLSQLGLIMVTLGSSEKSYCFFHLLSHAGFKALLFICIGIAIHTTYGTQDFRNFWVSPVYLSYFTFASLLSLLGFFFTSGFYRKDLMLESIYAGISSCFVILFLLGIGLTANYSLKLCMYLKNFSNRMQTQSNSKNLKLPLLCLGVIRIVFGSSAPQFTSPISIRLDHLVPLLFICLGMLFGNVNSPLFRSLLLLHPHTKFRYEGEIWGDAGIDVAIRLTSPIHALMTHHTAYLCLGLGIVLLWA